MLVSAILTRVRDRLDDTISADYLWSDSILIDHIDDAVNELATEIPLLVKTYTVAMVEDQLEYTLDDYVVKVLSARLGDDNDLDVSPYGRMVESYPTWDSDDSSTPHTLCDDYTTGTLQVYPAPDATAAALTLTCRVWRRPTATLDDGTDTPEIPTHLHKYIVEGVVYRAYDKHDSQTYNPKKAQEFLGYWQKNIEEIKRHYLKRNFRNEVCKPLRGNL